MKNSLAICFAALLFVSCATSEIKVTVENPSDFNRDAEIVEIQLSDLKMTLPETKAYVVKNSKGETVPSQVTHDKKLIFEAGTDALSKAEYTISVGEPQTFETKVYARLISERKDDFAWENNRVAFRIYGQALMASDGPSNGMDVWFKRTNEMVIDRWYKDDLAGVASYHNDNGQGLDDYKVGRSLGGGAMAPFENDTLWLNDNFVSQQILDNGPLRMTAVLNYNELQVAGEKLAEKRIISIDAGSQLTKMTEEYSTSKAIKVAAGIVKREKNDSVISSVDKGYIVYCEPASPKVSGVYIGMVFPDGLNSVEVNTYNVYKEDAKTKKMTANPFSHVLGVSNYTPGKPITYYTGYGWAKFGFEKESDFQKYVENFSSALKQPLKITIQ